MEEAGKETEQTPKGQQEAGKKESRIRTARVNRVSHRFSDFFLFFFLLSESGGLVISGSQSEISKETLVIVLTLNHTSCETGDIYCLRIAELCNCLISYQTL